MSIEAMATTIQESDGLEDVDIVAIQRGDVAARAAWAVFSGPLLSSPSFSWHLHALQIREGKIPCHQFLYNHQLYAT